MKRELCCTGIEEHESLQLQLVLVGQDVRASVDDHTAFRQARERALEFCTEQLLVHLERDETWLVRANGYSETRLLAQAMRSEMRAVAGCVTEIADASTGWEAVAAIRATHALLAAHVSHESLLVPVLTRQADDDDAAPARATASSIAARRDSLASTSVPAWDLLTPAVLEDPL